MTHRSNCYNWNGTSSDLIHMEAAKSSVFHLLITEPSIRNVSLVIICQLVTAGHLCDWQSWGTVITGERTGTGCANVRAEDENLLLVYEESSRDSPPWKIISTASSNCFMHGQVLWTLLPQRCSNRKVCCSLKICIPNSLWVKIRHTMQCFSSTEAFNNTWRTSYNIIKLYHLNPEIYIQPLLYFQLPGGRNSLIHEDISGDLVEIFVISGFLWHQIGLCPNNDSLIEAAWGGLKQIHSFILFILRGKCHSHVVRVKHTNVKVITWTSVSSLAAWEEISGNIHIMKFSTGKYLFNRMHESELSETQQIMNLGISFLHSAFLQTLTEWGLKSRWWKGGNNGSVETNGKKPIKQQQIENGAHSLCYIKRK